MVKLLNKESTINFLNAARQFVALLEGDNLDMERFYKKSHTTLSELYRTALKLETVELIYSEPESKFEEIDKDTLRKLNEQLVSLFGENCFYWKVFDPIHSKEKEPVQGWLVDDFADIYSELKEELTKIDQIGTDEAIEDALWQLKFGFNHHWGNHCIDAMRALHYLWYDGKSAL
ncbi:MAG TPA: DUF5063 domain-containing protein [Brumimicrobium sp.]|nr:DUF5063 domain-containing protein [Brumimicrobium sp.]